MLNWNIILPVFFTALVEWVEAFTIVLAVSLSIGWRAAGGASLAAFALLAIMTFFADGLLHFAAAEDTLLSISAAQIISKTLKNP